MRKLMNLCKFITAAGCLIAAAGHAHPSAMAGAQSNLARRSSPRKPFRAGAYAIDITPRKFPVIVNGSF